MAAPDRYMEHTSYKHILKYTSVFGTIQGLNILVAMIRNKLVAVILGPGGMGLIALFNSTLKLVGDSTNMGVPTSGVKTIAEAYESTDRCRLEESVCLIRSWSVMVALLGMLVCVMAAPFIDSFSFNWGAHTLHYLLLSPTVALMALTGGEMAVLKAVRQLGSLARISVYNVFAVLVVTIPLYYLYGETAIVPSLFLAALIQAVLTLWRSCRLFPLRLSFSRRFLSRGNGMLKLGLAFVVTGMMGSGMEFAIRSFLNVAGSLNTVGLYNAGYMMTMTYGGMVFSAMETDYYPRLSAVSGTGAALNSCVNRQIEVSLLIMAPLLVAMMFALPVLLPLLFSGKFLPVIGMMQFSVMALFLRAVKLPVAYIPLGRGDSRSFMFMEGVYVVMILPLMYVCFGCWGLTGTGVALFIGAVLDTVLLMVYNRWRYGYRPDGRVAVCVAMQLPAVIAAYAVVTLATGWVYWVAAIALALASLVVSLWLLRRRNRQDHNQGGRQ